MKEILKNNYLIILILSIGIFLRFYRIEANFPFVGEVGDNLIKIRDLYLNGKIPLLGPPTSHSWLSFGPLYYWIYGPILIVSRFNPLSHAYFGAFISVLIVIANFVVIRSIVNDKVAIVSSFLIAVSPLFLEFSRAGRFFSIVTLLVYPFLYFLYQLSEENKKNIFWLGVVLGSMFSFHFTPIMLIPFMISIILIKKINLNKKESMKILFGFLIPNIPFVIYDFLNGVPMTTKIILWIPYRVAGFVGLYPKNTISKGVVEENVSSLYEFIIKSLVVIDFSIVNLIVLILLCMLVIWLVWSIKNKKDKSKSSLIFFSLWFLWGYIAIFIHGSPPMHYFVPVLTAPIIILSFFIVDIWNKKNGKVFIVFTISTLALINFNFYFSDNWFYISTDRINQRPYYVPFPQQISVVKYILKDAEGEKLSLRRRGPYDHFEGDYAQNYDYLLWYHGAYLISNAKLEYTIIEGNRVIKGRSVNIAKINAISITKKVNNL